MIFITPGTSEIVSRLLDHSYAVLFPIALFEGPAVSVVAGFLIAAGYMSFLPAYLILVSANLIGDIVYYLMGRFVPHRKLSKLLAFFRVDKNNLAKVGKMYRKDRKKAIIFGKLAHTVGAVFLIAAGIMEIPFKEYFGLGIVIELFKSFVLLMIGYYFGKSFTNLNKTVDYTLFGFIGMTVILIVVLYFIEKRSYIEIEKMEK